MGNVWTMMVFSGCGCAAAALALTVAVAECCELRVRPLLACAAAAVLSLAVGWASVLAELGRPELIFGVLSNPTTSLFREFVCSGLLALCLLAYCIAHCRQAEASLTGTLAVCSGLLAVLLGYALGDALVLPWRAARSTDLIALISLAWVLVVACLAYRLPAVRSGAYEGTRVLFVCYVLLGALLSDYAWFLLNEPRLQADPLMMRLIGGDLALVFWGAVVLVGLVLPLLCVVFKFGRGAIGPVGTVLLSVTGFVAFQAIVFELGMPSWQFFGS